MNKEIKKDVVHFTNKFARNAQLGFTEARELKILLAIVAQTNPHDEEEEMKGFLSLSDMAKLIKAGDAKRSGSLASEIKPLIKGMMKKNYVSFPTGIEDNGEQLDRYRMVFDRLDPIKIDGTMFYEWRIHEDMRPFIKGFLKDFVSLTLPKKMRSGNSIRFLILASSHHNRLKAHKKITKLKITIEELKKILGMEGKYKEFKNFRRRVIDQIVKEINDSSLLKIVDTNFIRTGRSITDIEFSFSDGELFNKSLLASSGGERKLPKSGSSKIDLDVLTRSQLFGYNFLVERKCFGEIVYKQIIAKMPSSEYLGWEDVFIEKAWKRFEKVTKHKDPNHKAGAFVKWWVNGEFKDKLFPEIMEEVVAVKKSKNQVELDNRDWAKGMTNEAFLEFLKKNRKVEE